MKKILILGGSGLVGNSLCLKMKDSFQVSATYNSKMIDYPAINSIPFVIKNDVKVCSSLIEKEMPDVVVQTIAYSNVDFCETNKKDADFLHITCTKEISEICERISSKLIYLSTDWVFDGIKQIYSENDQTNPINYYGKTRIKAEEIVLSNRNNLVFRPALIYGWHPNSRFLNFIINNLKSESEIHAFTDQYATPTLVDDLAECIIKAINYKGGGIFHTVGSSCVNRFEFAQIIAEKFGLEKKLIKKATSKEKSQIAKRPERSCLDNSKASKEFKINFSTIEEGMNTVYKQSAI